MELDKPMIKFEREILIKDPYKLTSIIALNQRFVIIGNEKGNLIILDNDIDTNTNQMVINAHISSINYLNKTQNQLILSSAKEPDYTLKLWDFSGLVNKQVNNKIL